MGVNMFSCVSMNNQKCKVRSQIVSVNGNDTVFFPYSVKTSKCSGSCNNINNPLPKLCARDVVKNLKVKVFTLMRVFKLMKQDAWNSMKGVSVNAD